MLHFKLELANYDAKIPSILYKTKLDLPNKDESIVLIPKEKSNKYWVEVMKDQNFETEDQLDSKAFNKALWEGLKGTKSSFLD